VELLNKELDKNTKNAIDLKTFINKLNLNDAKVMMNRRVQLKQSRVASTLE